MPRILIVVLAVLGLVAVVAPPATATNGDNLMSIGPISRAMGGVGIAAPQDAISAVFSNPAAMCFGPYCPGSEFNFAGTLFLPKVDAKVTAGAETFSADAEKKVFAIPAIGLSVPITNTFPLWRFGLAAYGVSGLGVDYRGTSIDQPQFFNFGSAGQFPLVAGEFTQLQIMKFAPSIAFQPNERFSLGLAAHIVYSNFDLRSGTAFNYGLGVQLGALYKLTDAISIGATYISPQEVNHGNVRDFDGDGRDDDLKLESPQQLGIGIAVEPVKDVFLIEVDGKWINWEDAKGYKDFDWKDQWVLAIGAQFKPTKKLALRAGYNYGNNPVREHNGFVGTDLTSVQGKTLPVYYFETFRIIGFPAIVKQHITFGIGYELSKKFAINAGYTHAFKERINESGTNIAGQPTTLESTLSEDSLEFGFTWRF